MNGNEEPVEIEVEPEIHDILPFDDFCIDQYSSYDDDNDGSSTGRLHNERPRSHGSIQVKSYQQLSSKEFIYKCTVCRETLGSGKELLRHVRTHTRHLGENKNFIDRKFSTCKCCICLRPFGDQRSLRTHEETQHTAPFRCRFCNSFFNILKFYKNHLKQHAQQQQKQINSRVPDKHQKNMSHHNNKQSKESDSKHFYTSSPRATMAMAVQNLSDEGLLSYLYGSTVKPLKCKYCDKSFGKFSMLRKHELLHKMNNFGKHAPESEYIPLSDTPPSMAAITSSTLSNYNVKKSQPSSNSSSSALTLTPSLLSNLNKLAHLKSTENLDGKKPAILININTNDSSSTPNVEAAKKSQEMPLNSNSGLMISSVATVDKNYFETMEKLRRNSILNSNNNNNNVNNNSNLPSNATVLIQNGKKAVSLADLQCPICKKIVSQPFSLKVHLRTHTLEKPYSCPVCQKSFSQSCNLKTHMNIHTKQQSNQQINSQPYMCNICKRTFLKASSLNTHMITHTAKLYCYACNINFDDDAITYSQHMQITHNVTMTKDLISRAKANLQKSESQQLQQQQMNEMRKMNDDVEQQYQDMDENQSQPSQQQQKLMEVFKVQSSSVSNGQIPKLKITIKKEPVNEGSVKDGNESDSSSSSSNSSDSTSSSSSSSSSSSATSNSNTEKIDNK
ncbi:zinc finger protein 260-like [Chironomus tepperi]|uniref:zinc finger protein 260-like n=1 Tax=Chironomus tepperi TaxID=113505 RepID=UPI00391F7BDE